VSSWPAPAASVCSVHGDVSATGAPIRPRESGKGRTGGQGFIPQLGTGFQWRRVGDPQSVGEPERLMDVVLHDRHHQVVTGPGTGRVVLEQVRGHVLDGGRLGLEEELVPGVVLSLEVTEGGQLVDWGWRGSVTTPVALARAPVAAWRQTLPLPEHWLLASTRGPVERPGAGTMVARVAVTVLLIVVVVVSFPATVGVVVVVAWWLAAAFVLVIVPVGVAEATTPAHVGTPPTEATSPAVAVLPILPHCPDQRRDIEGGERGRRGRLAVHDPHEAT